MKHKLKKNSVSRSSETSQKNLAEPITEPALPLLLCSVTFAICLVTLIIDRFICKIGQGLLAPLVLQTVAMLIPAYLAAMLRHPNDSALSKMKKLGFKTVKAEYIFFLFFTSLFAAAASLTLTLASGGAFDLSRGLTLLGTFTAGENEYTVELPYLIIVYAIFPALCEEIFFRGVIFKSLEKNGFLFASLISSMLYALSGFSLGGILPLFLAGIISAFVLYTTGSLWSCVTVHFVMNLYRLFLEPNISAYFLSAANTVLLLITVALALCISALLFFSESARIFRKRSADIAEKRAKSASKLVNIHSLKSDLKSMLAYRPTLVMSVICLCIFAAVVALNYII